MAKSVYNTITPYNVPLLAAMVKNTDLQSIREAIASAYREKWVKAMSLEMESLIIDKKVFDLCPLPKGKKAIGCRWAYKKKLKINGDVEKFKA